MLVWYVRTRSEYVNKEGRAEGMVGRKESEERNVSD